MSDRGPLSTVPSGGEMVTHQNKEILEKMKYEIRSPPVWNLDLSNDLVKSCLFVIRPL